MPLPARGVQVRRAGPRFATRRAFWCADPAEGADVRTPSRLSQPFQLMVPSSARRALNRSAVGSSYRARRCRGRQADLCPYSVSIGERCVARTWS